MMKKRELTCIICPRGCSLSVTLQDNGEVLTVEGNACPRGVVYATAECTNPVRTVTTTIRCDNGEVLPVKTDRPVPKSRVFDVMVAIAKTVVPADSGIGDVIISRVADTDANVVITGKMP